MVIAIINQKGGVGKTTLAVHLACHLADQGHRVAFVDNDSQRSSSRWLATTAPAMPVHIITNAAELVEKLPILDSAHDAVICDGSPRLNDQTHVLMFYSSHILIPVRPSTLDLQATHETKIAIDRVNVARRQDGIDLPMDVHLVMNMVRTVGRQGNVMRGAMDQLRLPVARQTIGLRDAYSKSVFDDTVVTRMTNNAGAIAAASELLSLFNEVLPNEFRSKTTVAA